MNLLYYKIATKTCTQNNNSLLWLKAKYSLTKNINCPKQLKYIKKLHKHNIKMNRRRKKKKKINE